jgi:hypothetical protein
MNIQELSQYDIKNIDVTKTFKTLLRRKDILANIAIVFLAIFLANQILGARKAKVQILKNEAQTLQSKVTTVSEYESESKRFSNYVSALPQGPRDINGIVNKLNEFATKNDVQIATFSPSGQTSNDLFDVVKVRINISAKNFKNIGFFIYDIENSNNNLRVESWAIGSPSTYTRRRWPKTTISSETKDETVNVEVEIASIIFKQ